MPLTKPQFALPGWVVTGTGQITIRYNDASTVDVDITPGTYYLDGSGVSDLLYNLTTPLNTASDGKAGDSGTWAVSLSSSAPGGCLTFTWTGDSSTIYPNRLTFNGGGLTAQALGFALTGGVAYATMTGNTSSSTTGVGDYQIRYLYRPDDFGVEYDPSTRVTVRSATTPGGAGVTNRYASYTAGTVRVEGVAGARLWKWASADADLVGGVSGATVGDENLPFEAFWDDTTGLVSGGTPVTIRYARDYTAPDEYVEIEWHDEEQLNDLSKCAPRTQDKPLKGNVEVRFVYTGSS